jgi:protein-disulfide isomerase
LVLYAVAFAILSFASDASAQRRADTAAITDDVARVRVDVGAGLPVRGPADALVTIVLFSDFQCPFCTRVEPTLQRILDAHPADVRLVWRDTPLPFHANAIGAAEAAREAYRQRGDAGFWAMHDVLFENQGALDRASLEGYASTLGLDMESFRRALDSGIHRSAIELDIAVGRTLGVSGTPSVFINGRAVVGAQPYEVFEPIIDDELGRARAVVVTRRATRANYYDRLMRGAPVEPPPEPAADAPRMIALPSTVYAMPVGAQPTRGRLDALVTMVMFGDFECPFSARVQATLARLMEAYGADLRVVFRNNPLPFHTNASLAAEAALEAFAQRGDAGFWAMHDLLFANQTALSRADLEIYAARIGLDMPHFRGALDSRVHRAPIDADQALARQFGATGTPSFFINGLNVRGAQPYEVFVTSIDAALTTARARVAAGTRRADVYQAITGGGATAPVYVPDTAVAAVAPPSDGPYRIPVPASAPSRGAPRATLVVQIFADYQCPFSSRVMPTVDALIERYGDRVRFVYRDYPLPFHIHARAAAEAALEARAQRGDAGYFAMHDLLFENQTDLSRPALERFASALGLDTVRFRRALDTHVHEASIDADMAAVRDSGASIGTPSFFVGDRLVQGAQPIEVFVTAIDAALAPH